MGVKNKVIYGYVRCEKKICVNKYDIKEKLMNKIYLYLILVGIVVLSLSQIYLWKDQMEMWHQFNLHLMLDGSKSV